MTTITISNILNGNSFIRGEFMQIPLSTYLKSHTQKQLSQALNVEQSYISKALNGKKNIFIICNDDGTVKNAIEIKPFPNKQYGNKS